MLTESSMWGGPMVHFQGDGVVAERDIILQWLAGSAGAG
jgi:hypothetical protein